MGKNSMKKLIYSAMLLSLCLLLPLLTGQLKELGNAFCPMHLPVLICGFFCGPLYAAVIGTVAPLLRFLIFGMPPLYPIGISMCFELLTYGIVSGIMYKVLPKKNPYIYVSLITAMAAGRIVWGVTRYLMYVSGSSEFGWQAFFAGAVLNAIPGIILQIILIPILVMILKKGTPRI